MEPNEVFEKFLQVEGWAVEDGSPVHKILEVLAKYGLDELEQLGPERQDVLIQEIVACFRAS